MTKYQQGLNTTRSTYMMADLGWPLLETRRRIARLCLMYKMENRFVLMSYRSLLIHCPYELKDLHPFAYRSLDRLPLELYFNNSFFPLTVTQWNLLPESVFPAKPDTDVFKTLVWAVTP